MRHVILFLLLVAAANAQPFEGPFELLNTQGLTALTNPHIVVRDENRADIFWQTGDTVYCAAVSPQSGQTLIGQQVFPSSAEASSCRLWDVVEEDSGWTALVYDVTSTDWNRTLLVQERDGILRTEVLSTAQNYSGEFMGAGSWNYALSLTALNDGGVAAVWQYTWIYWNNWPPPGWSEAGCGTALALCHSGNNCSVFDEPFIGNFEGRAFSALHHIAGDSLVVILSGEYGLDILGFSSQPWHFFEYIMESYYDCDLVGALFTHGGSGLALSRSFRDYYGEHDARLLRLPNLTAIEEALPLDHDPIAAASHPDFGIAWLARYGAGLVLYRADTTGTLIFPAGAIHWPSEGFQIAEAALALSSEGLLVAIWMERETPNEEPTILRMASVGWNTYLDTDDSDFILHPFSFLLSTFPNPFNSTLQIEYQLPARTEVDLAIHNVLGQRVATLENGMIDAGVYRASWQPTSAGGIYFVTLRYDGHTESRKVLYLR